MVVIFKITRRNHHLAVCIFSACGSLYLQTLVPVKCFKIFLGCCYSSLLLFFSVISNFVASTSCCSSRLHSCCGCVFCRQSPIQDDYVRTVNGTFSNSSEQEYSVNHAKIGVKYVWSFSLVCLKYSIHTYGGQVQRRFKALQLFDRTCNIYYSCLCIVLLLSLDIT